MSSHARVIAPNAIATAEGVQLFYRDWNPGGRDPVLFVAGWSMPSDSWGYQMMALSRQGLRCLAFAPPEAATMSTPWPTTSPP